MVQDVLSVGLKGDASSLLTATAQSEAALKKFGATAASVTQKTSTNFTGLTRVIQDAPFGFIAIQNNIEQLVPAAGSLGLVISTLTAALAFSQVGLSNWTRGFETQAEKVKKAQDALTEYVAALDDTSKFQVTGDQDAQKGLINLSLVYAATQNHTLALSERKKAVDALQEQYPAYFKNLSDEAILAGGAQKAYEKLKDTLIATARARAAQGELDELAKEQRVIDQQKEVAQKRANLLYDRLLKPNENALAKGLQNSDQAFAISIRPALEAYKERNRLLDESNKLQNRQRAIVEEINKIVAGNGVETIIDAPKVSGSSKGPQFNFFDKFFEVSPKTADEKAKQVIDLYSTAMDFAMKNKDLYKGLDKVIGANSREGTIEAGRRWWADFQKGIFELNLKPKIDLTLVPPTEAALSYLRSQFIETGKTLTYPIETQLMLPKDGGKAFERQLDDMLKRAQKAGLGRGTAIKLFQGANGDKELEKMIKDMETLSGLVSGALQPALESAFASLFNGGNFMESLLQGLGKSVEQLIVKLASAAALSGIISLLVPGSNFGKLFSKFSGLPGFAEGGAVGSAGLAIVGEGNLTSRANPEVIMPAHKLNKMMGGGGGFIAETRISGGDIILAVRRAEKKQGRAF